MKIDSEAVKTSDPDIPVIPNVSNPSLPPPRIQRQNTLIQSDPKNFQAILSKDISTEGNMNSENVKETLKVPVVDIFPDQLTEQNYSRKKSPAVPGEKGKKVGVEPRKQSPVRKLSSCLEPHEPLIDSLPAPVPVNPAPRLSFIKYLFISFSFNISL